MRISYCILFNTLSWFCRTNILERYNNEEIRLTLPEGKRISRVKWFAVYDIGTQVNTDTYCKMQENVVFLARRLTSLSEANNVLL